jgi:Caspase domain
MEMILYEMSKLHALLIGIDCYLPNRLPDGGYYPSLGGCVRDINHVEDFLKRKVGISSENVVKLTSSSDGSNDKPSEPLAKWPTYDNMVSAFNKITKTAEPGDQVYVHYSGHGGRVKTLLPKIKGENGFDETLVPLDIGNSESKHLRDIEMAKLLQNMVDKKLIVTLVLDSCHSGGATRGRGGAVVRGIGSIDTTVRPQDGLVASIEELANTWQNVISLEGTTSRLASRNIDSSSDWLPDPKRYVLLAACRPSESAYEYAFEGTERNGALTYWLLKSLEQLDKGLTYRLIHDRIIAKIHSQFRQQTPMLEGDGDREIFGSDHVRPVYAVNVMEVNSNYGDQKQVLLNAGQVHGVRKSTQFAIYPYHFTDFNQVEKRIALVEIVELGSTNSWTKVTTNFERGIIEQGSQAVLIDPVSIRLKRVVRLVYQDDTKISAYVRTNQNDALEQIGNNITNEGKGFLELATENTDKAHYQVSINEKGEYEIWDPAGKDIPNLNPPLKINENDSGTKIIQRLVHLTKYSNIQQLDNLDGASPLSRKLVAELFGVSQDYEQGDNLNDFLQPIESQGNSKIVKIGQKLVLRIKNSLPKETRQVLNVTVLDLQPDWGILQIFPTDAYFAAIDPGEEVLLPPLEARLPSSYMNGKDVIKVFGTIDQTNFRWLELPSLDQPARGVERGNSPKNPLEELMATITKDRPTTRDLNPSATSSREWTTAQIEVQITQ